MVYLDQREMRRYKNRIVCVWMSKGVTRIQHNHKKAMVDILRGQALRRRKGRDQDGAGLKKHTGEQYHEQGRVRLCRTLHDLGDNRSR